MTVLFMDLTKAYDIINYRKSNLADLQFISFKKIFVL